MIEEASKYAWAVVIILVAIAILNILYDTKYIQGPYEWILQITGEIGRMVLLLSIGGLGYMGYKLLNRI